MARVLQSPTAVQALLRLHWTNALWLPVWNIRRPLAVRGSAPRSLILLSLWTSWQSCMPYGRAPPHALLPTTFAWSFFLLLFRKSMSANCFARLGHASCWARILLLFESFEALLLLLFRMAWARILLLFESFEALRQKHVFQRFPSVFAAGES